MKKLVIVGDFHLNEWADFSKQIYVDLYKVVLNSRLLEQLNVLEQILDKISLEDKVDKVILLGDVFHRLTPQTLFVALLFFKRLNNLCKDVVLVLGNHDYIDELRRSSYFDYLNLNNMKIVKEATIIDGLGFLPYIRDKKKLNNEAEKLSESVNILFTHNEIDEYSFRGIKLGNGIRFDVLNKFKIVFNGHYHDYDYVDYGVVKLVNVGSIMDFTFADSNLNNQKGILIYDLESDKLKKFNLKYKKFIKVSNVEDAKRLKEEYYVRVDIKSDEVEKVKELEEDIKVKVIPKKREVKVLSLEEAINEVAKQYKSPDLAKEFINSLLIKVKP